MRIQKYEIIRLGESGLLTGVGWRTGFTVTAPGLPHCAAAHRLGDGCGYGKLTFSVLHQAEALSLLCWRL